MQNEAIVYWINGRNTYVCTSIAFFLRQLLLMLSKLLIVLQEISHAEVRKSYLIFLQFYSEGLVKI